MCGGGSIRSSASGADQPPTLTPHPSPLYPSAQGLDLVQQLAALPRVKDNTASPFFQAGKAAGDKRADVAERAFGKPFAKIVVERCGLL